MKTRAAYQIKMRPGRTDGYRQSHRAVWPELIAAARECGIRNHSAFVAGDHVFLYLEADDVNQSLATLMTHDIKQRWDAFMQEFLEPDFVEMEEVFYME